MTQRSTEKDWFLDALELEGEARARLLAEFEARDAAAAARVRSLLAAHEGAADLDTLGERVPRMLRPSADLEATIVGDYELLEELASGASGVVWKARQRSLDRVVALKILRAGSLAGRREVERFRAEAEAVARLEHPHIVPVFEVGEHEGRHYFSMRLYEGGSLAGRVSETRTWEPRAAAQIVRTIAHAVHHAHQRGLLHRDLKPSNVLLDAEGAPFVADFGVAAHIDEHGVADVTATLAGTPAYMAPEQAGFETGDRGELTVATDVWALGCILYELLGGRPPFQAETLSKTLALTREQPPFPLRALAPGVPRDLETIVLCCLQKEPARRYASADALATDLERWLEHEPILARRTGMLGRLALAWRRNPVVVSLAASVVLLLGALAVGASWASFQFSGRLRDSYLGEARATRLSSGYGRRARALALLGQAARLRPGADLRDEAIACLAMTDLRSQSSIQVDPAAGNVQAVDLDGDVFAFADAAGVLTLRRLSDGHVLRTIETEGGCTAAAFSDRARLLAACVSAGPGAARTEVWDLASGERLASLPHASRSHTIDFDVGLGRVVLADGAGVARMWDLASSELVFQLDCESEVVALALDDEGASLALCTAGETPRLLFCSVPGGAVEHAVALPAAPFDLAWDPDGDSVFVACDDYVVYEFERGADAPRLELSGHQSEAVRVVNSRAFPVVATSSWDRTVRLWDRETGEELLRVPGHLRQISADGRRIAFSTFETLEVAELVHGEFLRTFHGHSGKSPAAVAFSRDGERIVSHGSDGARLWRAADGLALGVLSAQRADGVEFSPEGRSLYLTTPSGLERRDAAAPLEPGELVLAGRPSHCDLAADGSLFVVREGQTLLLFDPAAPADVRRIEGYRGLEYVAVSARGTYVVGMTWHGEGMSVWRAADGALLGRLRLDRWALAAEIAPDEERLVVSDGNDYEVYSLPGLERLRVLPRGVAMREAPGTIAFSEDGAFLALGHTQQAVRIYTWPALELAARLEGPGSAQFGRMAFSPDGARLAIASGSRKVFVWELAALRAELAGLGIPWE